MHPIRLISRFAALLLGGARPADPMEAAFGDLARELAPGSRLVLRPAGRPAATVAQGARRAA